MRKMIASLGFSLSLLLCASAHADQAAPATGTATAPAPAPPTTQPSTTPVINTTATTTYDPEVAKGCSISTRTAKPPAAIFVLSALALIPFLRRRRRLA